MGGSLASHGGQNPIEPIKLGAAILHGPHVWNFAEIYEALDAARGAELIGDVGRLTVRVGALLTDAKRAGARSPARRARPSSGSAARSTARWRRSIPISCRSGSSAEAACVNRRSGGGRTAPPLRCCHRWRRSTAPSPRAAWRERAGTPACRSSASAIRPSAAPARRRRRSRSRACSRPRAKRRSSSAAAMAGELAGPVRVDPARHRAADVGDEPLLLARPAPTIVARDRVERRASGGGGRRQRHRDGRRLSESVAGQGFFRPGRRCAARHRQRPGLPAGPLRAPLDAQLDRAQALIVVGEGDAAGVMDAARRRSLPVFKARLEPDATVIASLAGRRVLAFAGIGDPEKFFATLREAGVAVAATQALRRSPPLYAGRGAGAARRSRIARVSSWSRPRKTWRACRAIADAALARRAGACAAGDAGVRRHRRISKLAAGADRARPRGRLSRLLLSGWGNAAAARPRARHRLPAGRRSSISALRAGSACR